jgi:5'-nucleotidase
MKILATNDDGIYARGLWLLVRELAKAAEVTVVAPDREQSGVGTSVTLHHPLRLRRMRPRMKGIETYSVEGTPADSVILALSYVMKEGVDLVVSGINEGANLGNDVFISGTVGAALQGYFYGVPSLAIGVAALENLRFRVAAKLAGLLVGHIAQKALPQPFLLNITLPNRPLGRLRGIEVTRLGRRSYSDDIQEGHDGRRDYYWIMRGKAEWQKDPGTDVWAVLGNRISITPLETDLTRSPIVSSLKKLCPLLFQELRSNT